MDLPALFRAADASSRDGQRAYRWGIGAILVTSVGIAVLGAVGGNEWHLALGVAAAIVFVVALVVQVEVARRRPEEDWYDGRALAESAKSLAWQYAVAGGLYGHGADGSEAECDRRLLADLRGLLDDIGGGHLVSAPGTEPQITAAMRELRGQSLPSRRDAYLTGRVGDQRDWYDDKARLNNRRRRFWLGVVLLAQVIGGVAAVLAAAGVLDLDLLGIAGAFLAASVGWIQLGDYGTLASAYSVACHELGFAEEELRAINNEQAWVEAVSDAEQAISREHRMWRAARGARGVDV
ncbi:MAG: DUF4231 domain-containing protein [Actinomycetota bacterium]|nr:DUF4231 domain-containing protein [Actinomycetota bacterium]